MAVQKLNRTGEIANWIRSGIDSGALAPGTRLEERQLSEMFQVSKTPVREALIQLASRGLVDLRQRRGATVAIMSAEQFVAMFEVMTELECMAARLAATRMPPEQRQQLVAVHGRSEALLDDQQGYDAVNTELHEVIYRGACNPYLEASIRDARARLRVYRRYPFQKPGRIQQSFRDHAAIVAAIVNGDPEGASLAMHDHLTTGGRIFADLVAQMRSANDAP
ncbi:HTH-type transcriptional repressor RspR [Methylobacterium aerolatum]|nr:HTH-type transcriptional repressor RspR [Methylobacterium aerolatum]